MLTQEQYEKLTTGPLIPSNFKERYPDYSYYHGVVIGMDGVRGETTFSTDVDFTTYHALIIDNVKRESIAAGQLDGAPLKDMLTGKDIRAVVERFSSHDPVEIEAFIRKWLNPDFKLV